jgi:dihydroorotate dehydrogenase (NAD+) catalytic subunit
MAVDFSVEVGRVKLATPVVLASGCAGYGVEWRELLDLSAVGAVVLKGVSREPWPGNAPPRLAEAPAGVINAIGLENLPALADFPARVVANVVGQTPEEYREVCAALDGCARVDALEVNVSCPNVAAGGTAFCADAAFLTSLVRGCRKATAKPLWVKLAPMLTDVVAPARAALDAGADALTVANTIPAMAIDVERRRPALANVYGGLSGPAVRPINLRHVHAIYSATGADVIASGGVDGWEAAAAYMLAGARAVQLGTALFAEPSAPAEVVAGLGEYLKRQGLSAAAALTGALEAR